MHTNEWYMMIVVVLTMPSIDLIVPTRKNTNYEYNVDKRGK
jgi:hypothetical protein